MKFPQLKKMEPIEIVWNDSESTHEVWYTADEIDKWAKPTVPIVTIGYFYMWTKDNLVIVFGLNPCQYLHPMTIPKGCIMEIRRVKCI